MSVAVVMMDNTLKEQSHTSTEMMAKKSTFSFLLLWHNRRQTDNYTHLAQSHVIVPG